MFKTSLYKQQCGFSMQFSFQYFFHFMVVICFYWIVPLTFNWFHLILLWIVQFGYEHMDRSTYWRSVYLQAYHFLLIVRRKDKKTDRAKQKRFADVPWFRGRSMDPLRKGSTIGTELPLWFECRFLFQLSNLPSPWGLRRSKRFEIKEVRVKRVTNFHFFMQRITANKTQKIENPLMEIALLY